MIKPTLEKPLFITKEGDRYRFFKTFVDNKDKLVKFLSVIENDKGEFIGITATPVRNNDLKKLLRGDIVWGVDTLAGLNATLKTNGPDVLKIKQSPNFGTLRYNKLLQNERSIANRIDDNIIPQSKDQIKSQTIPKDVENLWKDTFNLKSIDDDFVPKLSNEVKSIIKNDIYLTKGSLIKLLKRDRTDLIPHIKQTLQEPDLIIKHEDSFLFVKDINKDSFLTSVSKDDNGKMIVRSNSFKRLNNLKNKITNGGKVLYTSKEAPNILAETFTAKTFQDKLAKEIIPQSKEQIKLDQIDDMVSKYGKLNTIAKLEKDNKAYELDLYRKKIEQDNNINPIKEFGTNYAEYYHDSKGAVKKLLEKRQGQVAGAFYRHDLGDIDLVWGNEKMGLMHILKRRGEQWGDKKAMHFIKNELEPTINDGIASYKENNKIEIFTENSTVVLGHNDKNKYVITSFIDKRNIKKWESAKTGTDDTLTSKSAQFSKKAHANDISLDDNIIPQSKDQINNEIKKLFNSVKDNFNKEIDKTKNNLISSEKPNWNKQLLDKKDWQINNYYSKAFEIETDPIKKYELKANAILDDLESKYLNMLKAKSMYEKSNLKNKNEKINKVNQDIQNIQKEIRKIKDEYFDENGNIKDDVLC